MTFRDRQEAGRLLAKKLMKYKEKDAVIYALPRGGVVLGAEVAKQLAAPLDLIIARKIGHPAYKEYAVCAVTESGYLVCSREEIEWLDPQWLREAATREQAEAKRRRERYVLGRERIPVEGKVAIVVDDGVATGLTMMAALEEVRAREPAKIILAIPVVSADVATQLANDTDEIVALEVADHYFGAISSYYLSFDQVQDDEVIGLLDSVGRPTRLTQQEFPVVAPKNPQSKRAKPGAKGTGNFYRIVVRPKQQFTEFRYHDVGGRGHLERLAGRRPNGRWATQAWLISKEDAHIRGDALIADSNDAKKLLDRFGSKPRHVEGDIFTAKDQPNIPEWAKPTPAQLRAWRENIKKAQAARKK